MTTSTPCNAAIKDGMELKSTSMIVRFGYGSNLDEFPCLCKRTTIWRFTSRRVLRTEGPRLLVAPASTILVRSIFCIKEDG